MRLRSSEHVPGDFEPLLSEDFFPTLESADRLPIEEPTPFLLASQALKFLSVRVAHGTRVSFRWRIGGFALLEKS